MKDRIRRLMEAQHMNQQSFAAYIGISTASLSSMLQERTKPTLNTVDAIHNKMPHVNINWLMFGVGEMFDDEAQDGTKVASPTTTGDENLAMSDPSLFGEDTFDQTAANGSYQNGQRMSDGSPRTSGIGMQHDRPGILDFDNDGNMLRENGRRQGYIHSGAGQKQRTSDMRVELKNIDKPSRKITEIRVYFDDQTWESFVPKK